MKAAYQALNQSDPTKTKSCWLCLNPSPPYYEGIPLPYNASRLQNVSSPPPSCQEADHSLTLTHVQGNGLCLGKNPPNPELCSTSVPVPPGNCYLPAPNGTYWACNTGLTPCVHAGFFDQTRDYCILVQVWPRITYHSDESVFQFFESPLRRTRREPVSLTLAVLLGLGGITAGIATGTTAVIRTDQYMYLHQAMNEDLRALEQSVRALKESLTSLSEVVLQNRRGLDLVLLKEGGLCAALREECCFYADQTGVVTETLDKLRERLDRRQQEFESQQGWYESIWKRSPWFTTLLSSLIGPIFLLILILTLGPCLFNRLTQFVRDGLSCVQAMVLTQQYQALKCSEDQDCP